MDDDPRPPDRIGLARDQMDLAVARLELARVDLAELDRLPGNSREFDAYTDLAVDAMHLATSRVVATVLNLGGFEGFDARKASARRWPARGVRWRGRYYLAVPNPELADDEAAGRRTDVMLLFEVAADAVVDLEWPRAEAADPGPYAARGERDRQVIARAAEALAAVDLAELEEVAGRLRRFNDREADRVVRAREAIDSARAILAEAG